MGRLQPDEPSTALDLIDMRLDGPAAVAAVVKRLPCHLRTVTVRALAKAADTQTMALETAPCGHTADVAVDTQTTVLETVPWHHTADVAADMDWETAVGNSVVVEEMRSHRDTLLGAANVTSEAPEREHDSSAEGKPHGTWKQTSAARSLALGSGKLMGASQAADFVLLMAFSCDLSEVAPVYEVLYPASMD